ncbi:GNAT family N-acetyltransferase [Legionella worsleiensis]|uniref:Putative acetyltransferase n=1 Tax=Legionella worsleiensis TaxID=45076 RepID=A0A0W1AAA6_9GAMM|nr:N-acetyltransferase [Legionella worsleiensis]KTD78249.1 putative acetyltransferase [Legionella worsleiensis]STY32586.1 ribosomal-protein-alanine acetyltransferase [Legionella worsleiensis]
MPIRPLTRDDKSRVLALDDRIFRQIDPLGGWYESDFDRYFNERGCFLYVSETSPEQILGYIFATPGSRHTYITNMGVAPESVRKGIGTELMREVMSLEEQAAKAANRNYLVRLNVEPDNLNAQNFYKKLGFRHMVKDDHGLVMDANTLPPQFNARPELEMEPADPNQEQPIERSSAKSALFVLNVSTLSNDGISTLLEGVDITAAAPDAFRELMGLKNTTDRTGLSRAAELIRLKPVRDYIYDRYKATTGNHVICHLDGIDEHNRITPEHVEYINEKLRQIDRNTHFDLLYFGGGHGHPLYGSSGLNVHQLQDVTRNLSQKGIRCSSIVQGSCFSSAYSGLFQPLLQENGVMLSNSLECGGNNHFLQAMEWTLGLRQEFYTHEEIKGQSLDVNQLRSGIRRIFEARGIDDEVMGQAARDMMLVYDARVRQEIPGLSDNDVYEARSGMYYEDLDKFIEALSNERPLDRVKIERVLQNFPLFNEHFNKSRHKSTLLDHLTNPFKPDASSVVIASKKEINLCHFLTARLSPNLGADYRENYSTVIRQIRNSRCFENINEHTEGVDESSVRIVFNQLFASVTTPQGQARQETGIGAQRAVAASSSTPVAASFSTPVAASSSTPVAASSSTPVATSSSTPVAASSSAPDAEITLELMQFLSTLRDERQGMIASDFWATRTPEQKNELLRRFEASNQPSAASRSSSGVSGYSGSFFGSSSQSTPRTTEEELADFLQEKVRLMGCDNLASAERELGQEFLADMTHEFFRSKSSPSSRS